MTTAQIEASEGSTRAVLLEVFSDVICPWCYTGKTKLDPALSRFRELGGQVEVRYRPYLLQPDFQGPSKPLMEYLTDRFGANASRMSASAKAAGAEVGLELDMQRAITADTHLAHQLIESAYRDGGYPAQRAVADELFQAHFTRGEDVADPIVLAAAGRRAGLDEPTIEASFTDPALQQSVLDGLAEAQQLGIRAVPTFVANRAIGVQGAQPADTLLALLEKASEAGLG